MVVPPGRTEAEPAPASKYARSKGTRFTRRLGALAKRRRKDLGLTQAQVADLIEMGRSHYASIEAGRCRPSWVTVEALEQALNCKFQMYTEATEILGM